MAVANPLLRLFDYLPLDNTCTDTLQQGMRFMVPFGSRILPAYLISIESSSSVDPHKLKQIIEQTDLDTPTIDTEVLSLLIWCSQYYHHNLGQCIHNALPKNLRNGGANTLKEVQWSLSHKGLGLGPNSLNNAKKQAALVQHLREHGHLLDHQLKSFGFTRAIVNALLEKELIQRTEAKPSSHITAELNTDPLTLNTEQQTILDAITARSTFECHLIYGVTGSGKTEVYLQSIAYTLKQGKQALVLIPEIALSPQTLNRFVQRFNTKVICLHSKLSDGQRHTHWLQAKQGQAGIIIGTRSAVFTPFMELGIIIVDESHDSAYKQQSGFQYSAKDVAIRRAQQLDIPIVLGSATPSIESMHNAQTGRFTYHAMLSRANHAQPSSCSLIDMRNKPDYEGFSQTSLDALSQCVEQKQHAIVFINRRGFAPTLLCQSCHWNAQCINCDSRLTLHKRSNRLICHHCNHQTAPPNACPQCHATKLTPIGSGTQRSEDYLASAFKDTPVLRIDRDSTQNKDGLNTITQQLNNDQSAILIGTQMLAKGHHFPNVTLVVVLDSDSWLFSHDFRGQERMAQMITQVSGRAGRDEKLGRTLIQTQLPEHPFWGQLLADDYPALANNILDTRRATALPPFTHMALFRAEHKQLNRAIAFLQHCRDWLNQNAPNVQALGPYPSALTRKANSFRFQLQLTHTERRALHVAIQGLLTHLERTPFDKQVTRNIDVDPQDTL